MLFYDEVFSSIQGESTTAGLLTTFVRLYGCPFRCTYCDQKQNSNQKKKISVANMVQKIETLHNKRVCITGGEPLVQDEIYPLVYALLGRKYNITIETSGLVAIDYDYYNRSFNYIMDIKCPSSGMSKKNKLDNLTNLKMQDEIKFVISNERDYLYFREITRKYPTSAKILLSPVFKKDKALVGNDLVEWMKRDHLLDVRLQIQVHKILGCK